MVGRLNLISHLLQSQADAPTGGLAVIQGAQVEVARLVVGLGGGLALPIGLKQEKFRLGSHVKGVVPHGLGPLQNPLQHAPRVTYKGGTVRVVHIADQPGHLGLLRLPGENDEAVQVGIQVLVGLVDADKALDGRAVQHDLVVHRLLNLGGGDGYVFQLAENVGELHPDELHVFFPHRADDILFGIAHDSFPLSCGGRFVPPPPKCQISHFLFQDSTKIIFVN